MREPHPLSFSKVEVHLRQPGGVQIDNLLILDWWSNISGGTSWRNSVGVPICLQYAGRAGATHLPHDDDVILGQIDETECLVHVSELGEVMEHFGSQKVRTLRVIELLKPLNNLLIDMLGDSEFTKTAYCQIKAAVENLEKHKEQVPS